MLWCQSSSKPLGLKQLRTTSHSCNIWILLHVVLLLGSSYQDSLSLKDCQSLGGKHSNAWGMLFGSSSFYLKGLHHLSYLSLARITHLATWGSKELGTLPSEPPGKSCLLLCMCRALCCFSLTRDCHIVFQVVGHFTLKRATWASSCPSHYQHLWRLNMLNLHSLQWVGVRNAVVLTETFLITSKTKHHFTCLLSILISSSIDVSCPFFNWVIFYFLIDL